MTSGRRGWSARLLRNESVRAFGLLHVPTKDPLRANRATSMLSYRYPAAEHFEEGGKYHSCFKTCLCALGGGNKASHNFSYADSFLAANFQAPGQTPQSSCTGALNYDPSEFEAGFLHFDRDHCCKSCAMSLDFFRECVLPKTRTGKWQELHRAAVTRAAGEMTANAGESIQVTRDDVANMYFENEEREEEEADAQKKKKQREETEAEIAAAGNRPSASNEPSFLDELLLDGD